MREPICFMNFFTATRPPTIIKKKVKSKGDFAAVTATITLIPIDMRIIDKGSLLNCNILHI